MYRDQRKVKFSTKLRISKRNSTGQRLGRLKNDCGSTNEMFWSLNLNFSLYFEQAASYNYDYAMQHNHKELKVHRGQSLAVVGQCCVANSVSFFIYRKAGRK